eukprot:scaffold2971_cov152-Skeletonema_menzelii.AAC.12
MSNGSLVDSTNHRPRRRRASLFEELDSPATTSMQQQQRGGGNIRPPYNDSYNTSISSWEHSDTSLSHNNSSLRNLSADPSENNNNESRVHRPSWNNSSTTILNSNNNGTTPPRPTLLQSVSVRGSFSFGRRSSAPEQVSGEDLMKKRSNSFRRLSYDPNRLDNGGKREEVADATVLSDYQEVFQQMKLQNPNSSLGALQQKTMKRMSELKVEKEEMERMNMERLKELEASHGGRNHHHGGSNGGGGGRMTLLGSLFHHSPLVTQSRGGGAGSNDLSERNNGSDRSDRDNNHNHSSSSNNNNNNMMPKAPYIDDSFRSNNSIDSHHHRPTNVLSRATILISRRGGNNQDSFSTTPGGVGESLYHTSRRSTMESNPLSEADGSTDNNPNSNNGGVILKTTLLGEDQKGNFAPRKSVGDLTAMMAGEDDDIILGSDRSAASGLFLSGDEESKASALQEGQDVFVGQNEEEEEETYHTLEILQTTLQQLDTECCDRSRDTLHSMLSDFSNHTEMTKGSSYTDCSGSLIVGFGKQLVEKEDESRGFAADFSAWDKR